VLHESFFLDASPYVLSVVTESPDRIFGKVVVPRNPIVLEKGEQAIAISVQPLLQSLRCIGLVGFIHDPVKECFYGSIVPLQMPSF
jgi:hypothetical protein